MGDKTCYRLLLISSEHEQVDATPKRVLLKQMAALERKGIACEMVIDPSQSDLEEKLFNTRYDAILPIVHFSCGNPQDTDLGGHSYSIPLLIEQMGQNMIGCPHYVQLLTMDKTVSLRRSGCGVPGAILTRQMFDHGVSIEAVTAPPCGSHYLSNRTPCAPRSALAWIMSYLNRVQFESRRT